MIKNEKKKIQNHNKKKKKKTTTREKKKISFHFIANIYQTHINIFLRELL